MAVVTLVAAWKMIRWFARRGDVVMTGCTTAGYPGMVHKRDRAPGGVRMAVRAEFV